MSSIIVLLSIAVCALLLGAGLTILLRPKSGGTDADLLARLYVLVEREAATARS